MELLIGCDPELFIKDKSTGKLISADGLFEGTKDAPQKVLRGAVQVDGMAAEYNIDPASSQVEFIFNNLTVLRKLRDTIKAGNPDLDFEFVFNPVADFGSDYINSQREFARHLGCTPDFNAYTGEANPTPDADMPFRTASGHIHLGWTEGQDVEDPDHLEACRMMVKQLDANTGVLLAGSEPADGKRRRDLYGKAGAFRPKNYGVEYRTPSNVWLNDVGMMARMYNTTKQSFDDLIGGVRYYDMDFYKRAPAYINEGDKQKIRNTYGYMDPASWDVGLLSSRPVTMETLDDLWLYVYNKVGNLTDADKEEAKKVRAALRKAKGKKADAGNEDVAKLMNGVNVHLQPADPVAFNEWFDQAANDMVMGMARNQIEEVNGRHAGGAF